MKTIGIEAYIRTNPGKQSARKLRNKGYIPAVFYGLGIEPVGISLNEADLLKQLGREKPEGTFVKLTISDDAGKVSEKLSILKELQIDTLKRSLLHADFYEIKMDREVTVDLPVHFTGHPVGVENGGEVQQLKREVKVSGLPGSLPEFIELDISGLDVGATLKVGDVALGDKVSILDHEDVALVTVAAMRVTSAEEAAGAEEAAEEGARVEDSHEGESEDTE